MKLTKLEKEMITMLIKYYEKRGEDNADFYNVFDNNDGKTRSYRGGLSSLIKKEIVEWYGNDPINKNCFNPIYKSKNWDEAVNSL